jgi:predicted dehydrogenase
MEKVNVAVVGCGNISDIYLSNMTGLFDILEVRGVTDLIPERARPPRRNTAFRWYTTTWTRCSGIPRSRSWST